MSIAKATEEYIVSHPSIKDCLKMGLINYSALSRKIIEELKLEGLKNFEAVLVASRRYAEKMALPAVKENEIMDILKKSRLETKSKMMVAILDQAVSFEGIIDLAKEITSEQGSFHLIEGSKTFTLITDQKFGKKIRNKFKFGIIDEKKDLVEILLKASKEIEKTSGIVAYLYSLFGENEINILETMSSWTDTLFVIEEEDLAKAMKVLKF